jgi:exodeoxyribonuclease-3
MLALPIPTARFIPTRSPSLASWSPVHAPDHPDHHHMRIDYVYFKGEGIQVIEAKIIGETKENADIVVSPYPSDHRAVVATFSLAKKS